MGRRSISISGDDDDSKIWITIAIVAGSIVVLCCIVGCIAQLCKAAEAEAARVEADRAAATQAAAAPAPAPVPVPVPVPASRVRVAVGGNVTTAYSGAASVATEIPPITSDTPYVVYYMIVQDPLNAPQHQGGESKIPNAQA